MSESRVGHLGCISVLGTYTEVWRTGKGAFSRPKFAPDDFLGNDEHVVVLEDYPRTGPARDMVKVLSRLGVVWIRNGSLVTYTKV